jgi:uncharacterized membrane protein
VPRRFAAFRSGTRARSAERAERAAKCGHFRLDGALAPAALQAENETVGLKHRSCWFALVVAACSGGGFTTAKDKPAPSSDAGAAGERDDAGDGGSGGNGGGSGGSSSVSGGRGGGARGGTGGSGTGGTTPQGGDANSAGEAGSETSGTSGSGGAGAGRGGAGGAGSGGAAGSGGSGGSPTRERFVELKVEGYGRSNVYALSGDGTYAVGETSNGMVQEAVRWTDAEPQLLGLKTGWTSASGRGVSDDGSVVVGLVNTAAREVAFRWHDGTLGELLPIASGTSIYAHANAVSGDGQVAIGLSQNAIGSEMMPVRWVGETGQALPLLDTHATDVPVDVSYDGGLIAGAGQTKDDFADEAVRWPENGIESLGLANTQAFGVSGDGHWIVGGYREEQSMGPAYRKAFRHSVDGFEYLPAPTGGALDCVATATSSDGAIVVGHCAESSSSLIVLHPFVWSEATGTVAVEKVLEKLDVDASVYSYMDVVDISADGKAILGNCQVEGVTIGWRALIGDVFP